MPDRVRETRARLHSLNTMSAEIERHLPYLWRQFFPQKDMFNKEDKRIKAVEMFYAFFADNEIGSLLLYRSYNRIMRHNSLSSNTLSSKRSIYFNTSQLCRVLPFPDFVTTLRTRPNEVIGCMGIAISVLLEQKYPQAVSTRPTAFTPRFVGVDEVTCQYSELKSGIVGCLVRISGYAIRVSPCRPLIEIGAFKCAKCKKNTSISFEDGVFAPPLACDDDKCKNRALELHRAASTMTDYQVLRLQEALLDDDSARLPRTFDVECRGDVVNQCIPGDLVSVVGIIKTMAADPSKGPRGGKDSGIQQLYMVANSVVKLDKKNGRKGSEMAIEDFSAEDIDCGDRRGGANGSTYTNAQLTWIRTIGMTKHSLGLLIASLCPSIFGHELVKAGIVLGLFGGTARSDVVMSVRNDIHVLVVGDPGLGKSQLLRAAANVAPRSVFVCGNTSTAVGLTVAISKEKGKNGEMAIEAGALVMADGGVCCIDELDKMACDPHALLEAMEQQSISIAKSGMVTSLRSRTSILAAANPVGGHYNRKKTVSENLKIAAALLSRFDLVFILLDKPDERHDRMISEHIMRTHMLANSSGQATDGKGEGDSESFAARFAGMRDGGTTTEHSTLSQRLRSDAARFAGHALPIDVFRSYIEYAKEWCHPKMTRAAAKVLQKLYLTMRAQSNSGESVPVTTRNLESLIRLAQARARADLRDEVTEEDANDVVQLLHEAVLDTYTTGIGVVDFTGRKGGSSVAKQLKALVEVLTQQAQAKGSNLFTKSEIADVALRLRLDKDADTLIESMRTECYLLLKGNRLYQLQTYS